MTTNVLHSVDVKVPVGTAYNQWTQFESFPHVMEGVERIDQLTPTRTHWVTRIAGVEREFDAEITEQHPDERVAWTTENGTHQAGVVTFHRIDDATTRVTLQLDHDPQGLVEKAGDALGIIQRRVKGDLANFKEYIESRGVEEGAWTAARAPAHPFGTRRSRCNGCTGATTAARAVAQPLWRPRGRQPVRVAGADTGQAARIRHRLARSAPGISPGASCGAPAGALEKD